MRWQIYFFVFFLNSISLSSMDGNLENNQIMKSKKLCVYLGANAGNDDVFKTQVMELAKNLVAMNCTLVYGGSSLGMMGLLATTLKELGGKAIGVITQHLLDKENPIKILDELYIVDSMQERKKMMQKLSDAFLVMPGGLGTLEEAFETLNAIKIGEINKKIGFLNVNAYFDHIFAFIRICKNNGFISSEHEAIPIARSNIKLLMHELLDLSPSENQVTSQY